MWEIPDKTGAGFPDLPFEFDYMTKGGSRLRETRPLSFVRLNCY